MERTIHVWHDTTGKIVAWGYVPETAPKHLGAIALAGPKNDVITAQISIDELSQIHETHVVELKSKKLVPRYSI